MDKLESKITGLLGPLLNLNEGSMPTIPVKKNKSTKSPLCDLPELGWKLFSNHLIPGPHGFSNSLEITLPIKTVSEGNTVRVKKKNSKYTTEHWTVANKRHKKQKNTIFWTMMECKKFVKLPCEITMIRFASRFLDADDNLRIALKWIKDQIAAVLVNDFVPGRADSNPLLKWHYDQVKCKSYAVKIIIEF